MFFNHLHQSKFLLEIDTYRPKINVCFCELCSNEIAHNSLEFRIVFCCVLGLGSDKRNVRSRFFRGEKYVKLRHVSVTKKSKALTLYAAYSYIYKYSINASNSRYSP